MPNPGMKINRTTSSPGATVLYRMDCDIRATPATVPLCMDCENPIVASFSAVVRPVQINSSPYFTYDLELIRAAAIIQTDD
jgi:hypothetical protein